MSKVTSQTNHFSQFNRSLRLYARKLGYSLNQRGLYRNVVRARDGTKVLEGKGLGLDIHQLLC